MNRNDPPLKSLMAFEATVRLGSMSAAARELLTSQPAVSQRIRQIEESVGVVLFDRSGRSARVTADGQAYYDEVAEALQRILGATRRLRARGRARGHVLTVAVNFGFAHLWLLPRLPRLEAAFPGTAFEVLPVDHEDAGELKRADLTIRFGSFQDIGQGWPLLVEAVFPVCSPAFARDHGTSDPLAPDLTGHVPLLHMDDRDPRWLDWVRWCELAGCERPAEPARFHYNNYPLLLNAAIEGRGLALGWAGLVDRSIAEGVLIGLGPTVRRPDHGYILDARHADRAVPAAVIDWFLREADSAEGTACASGRHRSAG